MPTDPHRAPRKQSLRGWNLGGVSYPLRWMVVLTLVPSRNKVPHLAEGCRDTGPRENAIFVGGWGGVVYHPKPRRRAKDESRVTSLSLRRSTNNVENVVVRLWQSSAICLRANARSAFLFTGSPRSFHSLAMTKGTKWIILHSLTTPAASHHPSNGGELGTFPLRGKFPFTTDGGATPIPSRSKFPSAEGCREAAGWSIARSLGEGWFITSNK